MPDQGPPPKFRWGDIIQVPSASLCTHGFDAAYGKFYGVVVSSRTTWQIHKGYEIKKKEKLEEEAKLEKEKLKNQEDKCRHIGKIDQNRELQKKGAGLTGASPQEHRHDGRFICPDPSTKEEGQKSHPLLEREAGGLYIVALISRYSIDESHEIEISGQSHFKGWFITTGLFVTVLDGQLAATHETRRKWGRLEKNDIKKLRQQLKDTFLTGWNDAADTDDPEPRGCLNRLTFGLLG